jgi:hypothetical protein
MSGCINAGRLIDLPRDHAQPRARRAMADRFKLSNLRLISLRDRFFI